MCLTIESFERAKEDVFVLINSDEYEYSDVEKPRAIVIGVMEVAAPRALPVPIVFDIDVSYAEKLRERYMEREQKISFTAILLKAISIAQREHPLTRSFQLPFGKRITQKSITAGFTVERMIDGIPAVFFGTIKHSDSKPILEIARELRAYGQNDTSTIPQLDLQVKSLKYPQWVRMLLMHACIWFPKVRQKFIPASFGVSSVGKWGCKTGKPPSICGTIFGVGEVEDRPAAVDGKLEIRPMVTVTYVFDHWLIDGGPACRFMKDVTDLLQGGLESYIAPELEALQPDEQEVEEQADLTPKVAASTDATETGKVIAGTKAA